jgi:hypothetical protein
MTSDTAASYLSQNEVRGTLFKRFEVNNVKSVTNENVNISREGSSYLITIEYDAHVSLFYNIALLVSFSDQGRVSAS